MNGNVERQLAGPASTMLDQVDPLCVRTSGRGGGEGRIGSRKRGRGLGDAVIQHEFRVKRHEKLTGPAF